MALVHFNMATFFRNGDPGCDASNWLGSSGSSNPASFAPTHLNVSQWVESMVALGATEAVLTAKHGCGFYLWPTNVTLPNGTRYPYRVVNDLYGVSRCSTMPSLEALLGSEYLTLTCCPFAGRLGAVRQRDCCTRDRPWVLL